MSVHAEFIVYTDYALPYRLMGGGNQEVKIMDEQYIENISNEYGFVKDAAKGIVENQGKLPDKFNAYNRSVIKDICPTLTASCNSTSSSGQVIMKQKGYRVRKLTPLECWRLMGFTDEDFYKAKYYTEAEVSQLKLRSKKRYADLPLDEKIERVSNSQLYKQAGNSIAVPCLEHILTALLQPDTSLLNWLDDLLGGNK